MPQTQVKCSVANCEYWADGNNCSAEVIMIDINMHADKKFDETMGGIDYDTDHTDEASGITDTICHTFEMRH